MALPIGILDQSPVLAGARPRDAVLATVALARDAERLGYHRYWLAEHHAMRGLADPAPEILLAYLAARDDAHSDRHRRRAAAALCGAESRRAVPHARRARTGPHRPGHRTRAGRLAARVARARIRGDPALSAASERRRRISGRHAGRRAPVREARRDAQRRHVARSVAAGLVRLQRRARGGDRACRSRSRTSSAATRRG